MSTQTFLPPYYDLDYILEKMRSVGVTNHYGFSSTDNQLIVTYPEAMLDAVLPIFENYETEYAEEILKPKLLKELSSLRWKKQQKFMFNGSEMKSDPETISSITAAVVLMDLVPTSPQVRRWKAGPNISDWVDLDKATLLAIGTAAAAHVQSCFIMEETLAIQIIECETVSELLEIPIDKNWPE